MSHTSSPQDTLTRIFSLMVRRQTEIDRFPPLNREPFEIGVFLNALNASVTSDDKLLQILSPNRSVDLFALMARNWLTSSLWLTSIDGAPAQAVFTFDTEENGRKVSARYRMGINEIEPFKAHLRVFQEIAAVRWNIIQLEAAQEMHKLADGRQDVHPAVVQSFHHNAAEMVEELNRWRPELAIHLR